MHWDSHAAAASEEQNDLVRNCPALFFSGRHIIFQRGESQSDDEATALFDASDAIFASLALWGLHPLSVQPTQPARTERYIC